MRVAHDDPDIRYLRRTPAGAEYVNQITVLESDRHTRSAFRDLVLNIVAPGARLFDFGAGPGIDARYFAELGFLVDAYDVDPKMREFFADHCRDLIDTGLVILDGSPYRDFLTRRTANHGHRSDLVISNFAPLNLIDDLHELFGKFHMLASPEGKVLVSVLNPCFIDELLSRWWWRCAPRLWCRGELFLPGPQAPHYRRLLRHFRLVSAPYFRLSHMFPGLPPSRTGRPTGIDLRRGGRSAWLHVLRSRYVFLLFEKGR